MKKQFNIKWSSTVKIITGVVFFILIGSEVLMFTTVGQFSTWMATILTILFSVCIIICWINAPKEIIIDNDSIILKTFGRNIKLNISDIEEIAPYSKSNEIRLFGSGGFLGYTGCFSNKQIGKYNSYVGAYKNAFYIKMKNGNQYVMSCENIADLMLEVNSKRI